jgi:Flp pilus assembly protein TadD
LGNLRAPVLLETCIPPRNAEKAIRAFEKALQLEPDNAEDYVGIGIAYCNLGKIREGAEAYRMATVIEPEYADAFGYLTWQYARLGEDGKAAEAKQEEIRLRRSPEKLKRSRFEWIPEDPDDPVRDRLQLGAYLIMAGQVADGIASYKEAILLNPDDPDAHKYLGEAYVQTGRLDLAWAEYHTITHLSPPNLPHNIYNNYERCANELLQLIQSQPTAAASN